VKRPRSAGFALLLVFAALAWPAFAARPVDERLFRALDGPLAPGARVVTGALPLDDGSEIILELSPLEVFAPGAEIVVHSEVGETRLPLPTDRWFTGRVSGEPDSLVVIGRGRTLRGLILTGSRAVTIAPVDDAYGGRSGRQTFIRTFSPETEVPDAIRHFTCGSDTLPLVEATPAEPEGRRRPLSNVMYYAGIAVETDYELYQKKGSASALAQYVGDLFAASSAIYQRDILVTLQVNHLSIWATASDPWTATSSSAALSEFVNYWSTKKTTVPRAAAHMLSGRGLGGGIAYLSALCSFGYGVSGNLAGAFSTTSPSLYWDLLVVSHELGHNFGSPHTHCYSPPVDQCYAGESGCYSGPTSVPAEKGTIMSYCHLLSGGYSNIKLFFGVAGEPSAVVTARMRTYVEGRPSCFDTVLGPTIVSVAPASGGAIGGTAVTITGTGFAGGAAVKIGGAAATSVVVVNATTITAVTPAGAAGTVDVSVVQTANVGATLAGGFTYTGGVAPPPPVSAATGFTPLTPCRVLDTRNPGGPLGGPAIGASSSRTFTLTGTCSVPSGAVAVSANLATVNVAATGDVLVYPNGIASPPTASTVSVRAGRTRANNAILYLASDGSVIVRNGTAGTLDVVVDVNGYFK
jgi:hypothetical protein